MNGLDMQGSQCGWYKGKSNLLAVEIDAADLGMGNAKGFNDILDRGSAGQRVIQLAPLMVVRQKKIELRIQCYRDVHSPFLSFP
jgi:hypothetical protein